MKTFKNILIALGVIVILSFIGAGISYFAGEYKGLDFTLEFFKEAYVDIDYEALQKNSEMPISLVKIEGELNVPLTKAYAIEGITVVSYVETFVCDTLLYKLYKDNVNDTFKVITEPLMEGVYQSINEYHTGNPYSLASCIKKIRRHKKLTPDTNKFIIQRIGKDMYYVFDDVMVNINTKKITKGE